MEQSFYQSARRQARLTKSRSNVLNKQQLAKRRSDTTSPREVKIAIARGEKTIAINCERVSSSYQLSIPERLTP